jgi:hypothetical protein
LSIVVPIPTTFEGAVWLAIGVTFGRAFGKKIDWDVINSDWFKKLTPLQQNVLSRVLDFLHHWWAGALLMLYVPGMIPYWFGAGLLLDDLPDVPERLSKLVNGYITSSTEAPVESVTKVTTEVSPSVTVTKTEEPKPVV